jgi:hypothetical protein
MPLTDAIAFQPALVPVVGIGVIKAFPHTCCFWIGVNVSQGIQNPSVVFWSNCSGVIPCLPEVPATTTQSVERHCWKTSKSNASVWVVGWYAQGAGACAVDLPFDKSHTACDEPFLGLA